MSYDNRGTIIGGIVAASALPESSVTSFFAEASSDIVSRMANLLTVVSRRTFEQLVAPLANSLQLREELLVDLINFGNSMDLTAHMKLVLDSQGQQSSDGIVAWVSVVDAALKAINSTQVQATAVYIYAQPFGQGGPTRQQAIDSTKAILKLPQQVDFDALLYKIKPRGIVYLAVQDEIIRSALTAIDIGVLSQAEKKIKQALKEQLKMTREHRKTASLANNISMGEAG